jgi:LCP family protein required for cell wall assembly
MSAPVAPPGPPVPPVPPVRPGPRRSPGIATLLSALIPGLGQVRLGSPRRGLAFGLPFVAVIAVAVAALITDPGGAVGVLIAPSSEVAALGLLVALAIVHAAAVLDAARLGRRLVGQRAEATAATPAGPTRARRATPFAVLAIALAWVVALYGTVGLVGYRGYEAARSIFVDPDTGFEIPEASFAPRPTPTTGPAPTGPLTAPPAPTATPVPVPAWAQDGRLNLLLVGSDAGPGRWLARMDSINVLSVDIASGRAAIFSIWRYTGNVPLPPESAGAFPDGRFPGWLNALYVYAIGHPKQFPGGDARGFRATTGAVQELIGQPLDGVVEVNLNGFVDLIDAIGGLWVDIPAAVSDPHYALPDGSGYITLDFRPGCQKLTGEEALAYARTRHQDSDWFRMRRQQRVLTALGRQLDPIGLLPRVPDLLKVAGDNLWTTIQPDEIADMAALAARVDRGSVRTYSFWPPETPQRLDTAGIEHVREVVATIFDTPAAGPTPTPDSTPKPCPRR